MCIEPVIYIEPCRSFSLSIASYFNRHFLYAAALSCLQTSTDFKNYLQFSKSEGTLLYSTPDFVSLGEHKAGFFLNIKLVLSIGVILICLYYSQIQTTQEKDQKLNIVK